MQIRMPAQVSTKTDLASHDWAIDDDVMQLRQWATATTHVLPGLPVRECTVGAAETCALRLHDPSERVSRLHARLVRAQDHWLLRDAGSKNGMRLDGARRNEIVLEPGIEIGLGGVTLIAESALSIALRNFLARLLGYGSDRAEGVDYALRSVRMAAARRAALVLCGDGDLVPTAGSIHRHARGSDRPFIVCDPRRQPGKATVRSPENYATGMEALAAASGGTLCVRRERLPRDFEEVVAILLAPGSQVQLVVCGDLLEESEQYRARPLVIPPLAGRGHEIDQIIKEYAADAVNDLAIRPPGFFEADHAWVREHATTSLPEIEKATLRLVALRASRTLSSAATRLGMAPISLSRWIGRRRLPMEFVD